MKKIQMTMATTHIDRHGDKLSLRTLETAVNQIKNQYLPFINEHDVRYPPIGRVVSAAIIKLQDGEYALQGTAELFEESDSLESLKGDGREIPIKNRDIQTIAVEYDRTFLNEQGKELLHELSQISGKKEKPRIFVKKALEPISTLIILAGIYIAGSIAGGFFSKLGSDAYDRLKDALIKYFRKRRPRSEQILDFCFLVKQQDKFFEVSVLVVNPSEQKLNELFTSRFKEVDILLSSLLLNESNIAKVVFEYKNQRLSPLYVVRRDSVPLMFISSQEKESREE